MLHNGTKAVMKDIETWPVEGAPRNEADRRQCYVGDGFAKLIPAREPSQQLSLKSPMAHTRTTGAVASNSNLGD